MTNKKLSDEVIAARMVELRNLRTLHAHDRQQIIELKADNHELRELLNQALAQNKTQAIQIAELQTMVFGKKRKPPRGDTPSSVELNLTEKQTRTKASYRRPLPPATAITSEVAVPLPAVCVCGGSFGEVTTHNRYQEDIPLPELTPGYQPTVVTKYIINRGICIRCGKATSGKDLGGQAVTLGPNLRLLICHLVSLAGMSYNGVVALLHSLYGIPVSDGEIAHVVAKQHRVWLPAYEQLKADIRAAPAVHADETPWAIQQNDGYGYAWSLSDATSPRVYYALENSRGATHAKQLFGTQFTGVRVSDDYGAYRALPGIQQLCWAHLYRVIRDLRYNDNLPEEQLPAVSWWYEQFAGIYQDLRTYLSQPYDPVAREAQSSHLWQRLTYLLVVSDTDPVKLTKLKAQLTRAGQAKLFACLIHNAPCDNNRAERDLRQLVLKRKRSFGSQTERGAKALATVLSLCTTTWRTQPVGYFQALAQLG